MKYLGAIVDDNDIATKKYVDDHAGGGVPVYDLGAITPDSSTGIFYPTAQQITDITALWNDGFCVVLATVGGEAYFAFKERAITYSGLSFMAFVGVNADIPAKIVSGKTLIGISSSGMGIFATVTDPDSDDIETIALQTISQAVSATADYSTGTKIATVTVGTNVVDIYVPVYGGSVS